MLYTPITDTSFVDKPCVKKLRGTTNRTITQEASSSLKYRQRLKSAAPFNCKRHERLQKRTRAPPGAREGRCPAPVLCDAGGLILYSGDSHALRLHVWDPEVGAENA